MKVISGGQCGADIAFVRAARLAGFDVEVNIHDDIAHINRAIVNNIPYNIVIPLSGVEGLRQRTTYNVIHSDVTILVVQKDRSKTPGSKLTEKRADEWSKNLLKLTIPTGLSNKQVKKLLPTFNKKICDFLVENNVQVLNGAGNRDYIGEHSFENNLIKLLFSAFKKYREEHLEQTIANR